MTNNWPDYVLLAFVLTALVATTIIFPIQYIH